MSKQRWTWKVTSFQLIVLGFLGVILLGAFLLMGPWASQGGVVTPFREALFTSTSAACVTGLVVHDTGTYWSSLGQGIILLLIQIGGLGVITVATSFMLLVGKNISLRERSAVQDALSAPAVGGMVRLTKFILLGTFLIELTGAFLLAPSFVREAGPRGLWYAIFHSISAFCNAGFDLLGQPESLYPSLTGYARDPLVNGTIIALIIVGGLGFLTWDDLVTHRAHFKRYRLQSKVILATTACLILLPGAFFFFVDFSSEPFQPRLLLSLFQAVTPRTAGFNTVDFQTMTDVSRALLILLMLVGGAPGSTAGGMKVTTLMVLVANTFATFRKRDEIRLFHRRLDVSAVKQATIKGRQNGYNPESSFFMPERLIGQGFQ